MLHTSGKYKEKGCKTYIIPFFNEPVNWKKVALLNDFTSFWLSGVAPETSFQAFHDRKNLYFRFIAMGSEPLVYVNQNDKMEVIYSERVELFLCSGQDMDPYYCLEMDPFGRVLDYRASFYRSFMYEWQWPDALFIQTDIQDTKYTIEGRLNLTTLKSLNLLKKNEIRAGLFRGHCTQLEGTNASMNWISWINPETPKPDFHVPSAIGKLILAE